MHPETTTKLLAGIRLRRVGHLKNWCDFVYVEQEQINLGLICGANNERDV